jgi:hypothetical protein
LLSCGTVQSDAEKFLRKLRQIEEHARALTQELPAGEAQNRARLAWGIAAHLVLKFELEQTKNPAGAPTGGASPLRPLRR